MELTDAWNVAAAAAPAGWRIQGLRCTSQGLEPEQRDDRWHAEACGPDGECIAIEHDEPETALRMLADRLHAQ